MFDYQNFRTNVLQNLEKRDFNKPICEALLNQKYFNGIGNYLRAEILDRACVYPFARARDVLECLQEGDQWSMPKVSTAQDLNTVKRSANNNTWGTEEKIQGHTEAEREHVSVGVGAGGAGGEGGEADDNDNDDDDDDIDWSGTGIDFSTRGGWHSENSQVIDTLTYAYIC